ncbi:MAG: hypothetical protein K5664_01355 [Firmicutes bacterium]|nr:hypothetical protein [Bacillota bacterium]
MLLTFVTVIGVTLLIFGEVLAELAPPELKVLVIAISVIAFLVSIITAVYIDYKGGKYKCLKCGKEFVPTVKSYIFSPHFGTTRHLKCPECSEKSWCKQIKKRDVL